MLAKLAILSLALAGVEAGNSRKAISEAAAKIPGAQMTAFEKWEFIKQRATVVDTPTTAEHVQLAGSGTPGTIGWATYTVNYDLSCSGPVITFSSQYGTCLNGETPTDSTASQMVTFVSSVNGNDTFTSQTYSTLDCSGTPTETTTMSIAQEGCTNGFTWKGTSDSFKTTSNAFNAISYNTASECTEGDYDNVESSYAIPTGKCVAGVKYTCSSVTIYGTTDCSGAAVGKYTYKISDISTCALSDDSYYYDDDDDDFSATEYNEYKCNSAGTVVASGALAMLSFLAASFLM